MQKTFVQSPNDYNNPKFFIGIKVEVGPPGINLNLREKECLPFFGGPFNCLKNAIGQGISFPARSTRVVPCHILLPDRQSTSLPSSWDRSSQDWRFFLRRLRLMMKSMPVFFHKQRCCPCCHYQNPGAAEFFRP